MEERESPEPKKTRNLVSPEKKPTTYVVISQLIGKAIMRITTVYRSIYTTRLSYCIRDMVHLDYLLILLLTTDVRLPKTQLKSQGKRLKAIFIFFLQINNKQQSTVTNATTKV